MICGINYCQFYIRHLAQLLCCGVEILNAQVAAEQMQAAGFRKPVFIKREIPNKMITPWRDIESGKFTGMNNPSKMRAYEYEYVVVMEKV